MFPSTTKDQIRYEVVAAEDEYPMKSNEDAFLSRHTLPQWADRDPQHKGQYQGQASIHTIAYQLWRHSAWKVLISFSLAIGAIMLFSTSHARITWAEDRSIPQVLGELPWSPSMSGLNFSINDTFRHSLHPQGLGKDLVILDVDTRVWTTEDASNMSQLTWGRLNHYLYAQMHGYDYKFVRAPEGPNDTHATWVKVQSIREVLKEGYKFVVFTDSDVVFPHLRMSMEYLMERWNVTAETAVTIGHAPKLRSSMDHVHHQQGVNTGFMMVQNTSVTDNMFKDWAECPSEVKYPGCAHWKDVMWHEQSAYNDYIRYDYPNVTREVPCNEVNGAPEHREQGEAHCDGILVRHYWVAKNKVKEAVQASIAEAILPGVIDDMMREWTE